jgi:Icc-related predicted phosphoesterase
MNEIKEVPYGDVFVFAGDYSLPGREIEMHAFASWVAHLPHKYKVIISGNHDRAAEFLGKRKTEEILTTNNAYNNIFYLENSTCCIEGINFYGSPNTPELGNWAFMRPRSEIGRIWYGIPDDTNVLITHGPPRGICDASGYKLEKAGCEALRCATANLSSLKVHIFGHIHHAYGSTIKNNVLYANVSTANEDYEMVNPAVVIDV